MAGTVVDSYHTRGGGPRTGWDLGSTGSSAGDPQMCKGGDTATGNYELQVVQNSQGSRTIVEGKGELVPVQSVTSGCVPHRNKIKQVRHSYEHKLAEIRFCSSLET